jgi:hypothetical protein
MYKDPDNPFSAQLSSCKGKGCKVIQPRCTDPKQGPDNSAAASPPVLFCPKDLSTRSGSDAGAQEHNKLVEMCKVAFPDDDAGTGTARSGDGQSAKGAAKQPPSPRADQGQRANSGARPAPPVSGGQARQAPGATSRQFLDAFSQGLAAAAGAMAKRPVAKAPVPSVPTTSAPQAGAAQFQCRDRRQYDACIPQYISRGLPYGYEGRDIRQVAHEYCQRNFCQ